MKNIGWSKKKATQIANLYKDCPDWEAYPQKEDHFYIRPKENSTYQWIVVLQKRVERHK